MSYIESFKAVMDEARILMADCDMPFLDKLQAAHDAEMKQLSKEEFHRGFESGVATRDVSQWKLDRMRNAAIQNLQVVEPSELCGSHEILNAICKAIFEPPMGWTIGAGEILRDHLVYLLGGENVKLPAELDAEFSKNGENHQTGGYDVLGNERNKVVCELQKLRDRGSVWGRELVVALGLSVEATNDDFCDRLVYLLGGKSVNKGAETSSEVIQNGEKYQLTTYDALGNERHKAACNIAEIDPNMGGFVKNLASALGVEWMSPKPTRNILAICERLVYLLDGSEYGLSDRIDGSGSCMGDSMVCSEHCEDTCDGGCERLTALDDGTASNDDGTCPIAVQSPSITDELRKFAETFRYEWYDEKDGSVCYTTSNMPPTIDSVNGADYINGIADRIDEQFERICSQHESVLQQTLSGAVDEHEREMAELMKKLSARDAVIDSYHERMKGLDEAERRMAVAESKCEELRKMLIMQDYVRGVIDQEEAVERIERLRDARD